METKNSKFAGTFRTIEYTQSYRVASQQGRSEDLRLFLPRVPRLWRLSDLRVADLVGSIRSAGFNLPRARALKVREFADYLFVAEPPNLSFLALLVLQAEVVVRSLVFDGRRDAVVSARIGFLEGLSNVSQGVTKVFWSPSPQPQGLLPAYNIFQHFC